MNESNGFILVFIDFYTFCFMEEKELFEDYEIKNWEFSPRLFKVFGAGTLVAFLTVFAFGQFNLMQSKACDNAVVGTFCQVLDAAYIATTFAQEDGEWASRDYNKETIQDADVTFVDVSAVEPPLQYPEGYFALANPEQYSQMPNPTGDVMGQPFPTNPTFPTTTFPSTNPSNGADMLNKPAELPKQNNDPIKGNVPDGLFSVGDDNPAPTPRPNKTPKPPNTTIGTKQPNKDVVAKSNTNSNSDTSATPEPSATPVDPLGAVSQFNEKFNKKPLQDFADDVIVKTDGTNKIDLTKPFMVEMQGVLDKEGKLDTKKSRFIDDDGDPNMVVVAKSAIEAVNNSGLFSYLRDQGVEKVSFVLIQNDKELTAVIKGNLPNEEKARTVSSGISALLSVAKLTNRDEDLKTLMNAAKFTTEKKDFVMNFVLPKEDAHKLIDKKLQEARIKKSQNTGGDVSSDVNAKAK
jgi:hypothetical protein